jgi:hypothetical protein
MNPVPSNSRGALSWSLALLLGVALGAWLLNCALTRPDAASTQAHDLEATRGELEAINRERQEILADVLAERISVPEGLVRFQRIYKCSAVVQYALRVGEPGLGPEEAVRTQYLRHLHRACEQYPDAGEILAAQIEAFEYGMACCPRRHGSGP